MAKAWHTCPTPGCHELIPPDTHRCARCARASEQRRGTAAQRGYSHRHRTRFREAVLARDPVCVICHRARSTRADHYPLGRDELVRKGFDPDDPMYGRGLCASCDSKQTIQRQPGGFAQH